jgi:hypothetical protein
LKYGIKNFKNLKLYKKSPLPITNSLSKRCGDLSCNHT